MPRSAVLGVRIFPFGSISCRAVPPRSLRTRPPRNDACYFDMTIFYRYIYSVFAYADCRRDWGVKQPPLAVGEEPPSHGPGSVPGV